MFSVL